MDILEAIISWTITIAIALFVILSIVLFIKDGISSKKEAESNCSVLLRIPQS